MRKIVMMGLIGLAVAGVGAASLAQPAGAPPGTGMGPGMGGPGMGGPGMMQGGADGMHHGGRWHRMHGQQGPEGAQRPFNPRDFALLQIPEDRKLTVPEVQKIAEGMLLWFGNRTWKVTDVKEAADNQVGFALTLPEGGVVARFNIDRKTGRIHRAG